MIYRIMLMAAMLAVHDNTNVTTDAGMSVEMKTYYSRYLIEYTKPLLVHDQFGQKHNIPKNNGKTIEFRKKSNFPKALTPLTEGVTPSGRKLEWSKLEATVNQYGDYVELSDRLITETYDDEVIYATENCGDQAGRTGDTITREVLNGGTNVQYGEESRISRHLLVGGESAGNDYMSVKCVKYGVHNLKNNGASKINGDYVAIIHPDAAFDLTEDDRWIDPKKYTDPSDLYNGEIGKIQGCRFVETTEAKIFTAADLTSDHRTLTVASYASKVITIDEALSAAQATALKDREVIVGGQLFTVKVASAGAAGAATITINETPETNPADGNIMYPGEAGAKGRPVYSTLMFGADAYGVTGIDGEGLQQFIKQLGSAGTSDPLNQRATVGWKMSKAAIRLVEAFMLRIETASTFVGAEN